MVYRSAWNIAEDTSDEDTRLVGYDRWLHNVWFRYDDEYSVVADAIVYDHVARGLVWLFSTIDVDEDGPVSRS